jgi:imidazolonepropionase
MTRADFVVRKARRLFTCAGPAPRRGPAQSDTSPIEDGAVASLDGRIVFVGTTAACAADVEPTANATVLDAAGADVVPGFVDPHTHLVYGGDRRHELRERLAGATYAEIAAGGGGILSTVAATRAASDNALLESGLDRLAAMSACGTTTVEIKSGYGLGTGHELRMLRAVRRIAAIHPGTVVATFLGAHAVPPDCRDRREAFVATVIGDMLPAVAAEGLATWCDVFCDRGAFTVDESRRILLAASRLGFKLRLHADELASSGGARLASEIGARSADHLVYVTREDARRLAVADVCATLLPAAAFYLKLGRFAPARMLIEEGVPVALATDVNPGGGYSPSMPFAMTLACFAMDLTFEEALVAATLNAAWALDVHGSVGSLERGKRLDAVIVEEDAVDLVRVGAPAIRHVVCGGRVLSGRVSPTARHGGQ